MGSELELIRKGHGKWSKAGVPHKGWACTNVDDLGPDKTETCQMCEAKKVRFGHHMAHPDYQGTLRVGCVCAGHMEQDPKRAERREKEVRSRAKRRSAFLGKKWKISEKGNPCIKLPNQRHAV